jgi:hypothetical protein
MPGEDFVDERLIADTSAARFLPEPLQHISVEPNGDQQACVVA